MGVSPDLNGTGYVVSSVRASDVHARPRTPTAATQAPSRAQLPDTPKAPSRSTLRNKGHHHPRRFQQPHPRRWIFPPSSTDYCPRPLLTSILAYIAFFSKPVRCQTPPSTGLRVTTFNCGQGGLRARLADIFLSPHPAFADADIILLQEAHVSPPLSLQDQAGLARFLGSHSKPHFRATLTANAGILVLSATVQPLSSSSGPRWAQMRASIRTVGLASAAAFNMDLWSIHGPVRPSTFWTEELGPALTSSRLDPPLPDLLIGADWNALPDPTRDSLHGTGASCSWSPIAPILGAHLLIDVDRVLRPEVRVFSRIVRGPTDSTTSAKRSDSIWASTRLLPLASPARYVDTSSNHRVVSIRFELGASPPRHLTGRSRPWSRWTLHPGAPTF